MRIALIADRAHRNKLDARGDPQPSIRSKSESDDESDDAASRWAKDLGPDYYIGL